MPKSDLQRVANFGDASEAEYICSVLKENGLDAFVDGAAASSMMPHVGVALGGVSVFVRSEDVAAAREIIDSVQSAVDNAGPVWFCGPCQVEVESGFEVCWSCGELREDVEAPTPDLATDASEQETHVNPDPENVSPLASEDVRNPYAAPRASSVGNTIAKERGLDQQYDEEAERNVKYAFRAAIIGLVFLPVIAHIYAIYLLGKVSISNADLSPKSGWKFVFSILLSVAAVVLWQYIIFR